MVTRTAELLGSAEAEALLRERKEGEELGLLGRFFLGAAVGNELGKFGDLGRPAAVGTLLVHDRKMHRGGGQRGAAAPPCPATDSFQMTASSTA